MGFNSSSGNDSEKNLKSSPLSSAIFPVDFSDSPSPAATLYLAEPCGRKLTEFFLAKTLPALKREEREERWYPDWIAYQTSHKIYARLLAPGAYSTLGSQVDLLRLTRFLEIFGYFSPGHGYSLQVSFLGLFPILMSSNEALKREAIALLEAGGLFAFGISEKDHGSDLLANEFTLRAMPSGNFVASGKKYYIGNANCASMISILARQVDDAKTHSTRAVPAMFALRPAKSSAFGNVRKISTVGVRQAFVGEFEVTGHELPPTDLIAQGRDAWDAAFGTITLGKFFLGFGSIGICEHAFSEALRHVLTRVLYGKPVFDMSHIRGLMTQAYASLTAMKLYAYRALDYVQHARETDRRYLLFTAVQKARVSTEGVKALALMAQCIGAIAFESDHYFEMAQRDAQLIPSLEGSVHVNLALTAQFIPRYFNDPDDSLESPESAWLRTEPLPENPYLFAARTGSIPAIGFPNFLGSFRALISIPNVGLFTEQAEAFSLLAREHPPRKGPAEHEVTQAFARCLAIIAYAQLVCENAVLLDVPHPVVGVIFHAFVRDLTSAALELASLLKIDLKDNSEMHRLIAVAHYSEEDWGWVSERIP